MFSIASLSSHTFQLKTLSSLKKLHSSIPVKKSTISKKARNRSMAPTSASSSAGDVQGDMLAPSVANRQWVRFAVLSLFVGGLARSTGFLPSVGVSFVHLTSLCILLGSNVWTTFVAGITMFKNLPRQTFGRLQAKLFPLYFGLSSMCTFLLLGTLQFGFAASAPVPPREFQLLGLAFGASLANFLFVEPQATSVMFERYALENAKGARDEEKIKKLYKQFGKWHGISSLFNLIVLVCTVGHTFYLASHLAL